MADFPDAPDVKQVVDSAEDDRFSRRVAVVIVLVTLAAAITAWLQAGAGRDDSEAAVRAERLASQTLGTIARDRALAELRVQREQLADERGRRAESLARQRAFGVGDSAETRALERGWRRAEQATERTTARIAAAEGIPPIEGELRPDRDPAFPNAYLTVAAREGERLSSLRDAANREGDRAEEQVGVYGVVLAMFAVSVFLLGYSLTPYGRRNRAMFAGVAGVMATAAAAWTLVTVLDPPDRPPEEAAAAFADAQVAIARGDGERAAAELDRAIELRAEFPSAYAARGLVRLGVAGAKLGELPRTASGEDLRSARDDLAVAVELDPQGTGAVLGLASAELLLGLAEDDEQALERAAVAAAEAVEQDPDRPAARYLLAEALLAVGEREAAEPVLEEAVERTALADDGDGPRDEAGRRELVGGALSAIERLAASERLDPEVADTLKGEVVAGSWPDVGPPQGGPASEPPLEREPGADVLGELDLDLGPAGFELGWPAAEPGASLPTEGDVPPLDAGRDAISAVLYARDESGDWFVVPELSGPLRRRDLFFDPSSERAFVRREQLPLTVPPRCLPSGHYKAEVYVNGTLAGEAVAERTPATGGAELLDGLALLVCPPPGWKRIPRSRAGVVDGMESPDGKAGLLAVRVPQPAAPGRGRAATEQALEAGLGLLEPLIPGRVEGRDRFRAPFLDATTAPNAFINTDRGGAAVAAARLSQDQIVVGAVYGPRSFFRRGQALPLFQSFSDRFGAGA